MSLRTLAMRSAALPSHNGGIVWGIAAPDSTRSTEVTAASGSDPTSVLVPSRTVTGRSVLSRRVRHGIPSMVVSS